MLQKIKNAFEHCCICGASPRQPLQKMQDRFVMPFLLEYNQETA